MTLEKEEAVVAHWLGGGTKWWPPGWWPDNGEEGGATVTAVGDNLLSSLNQHPQRCSPGLWCHVVEVARDVHLGRCTLVWGGRLRYPLVQEEGRRFHTL